MKGFGDLFKQTLREYGDKFMSILRVFLMFWLIPVVFFVIIFSIIFIALFGSTILSSHLNGLFTNPLSTVWHLGFSVALFSVVTFILFLALVTFMFSMSLSYIYIGLSKKKDISIKEAFNQGVKKYFWKYSWFLLVSGFFLALLFLLLIPGIIFSVYWIFGVYILLAENKGIMESLKRSREIVKGNWWNVLGFLFLIAVISCAVSFVGGLIPLFGVMISPLVIIPFVMFFFKNMYLDMIASKKRTASRAKKKR